MALEDTSLNRFGMLEVGQFQVTEDKMDRATERQSERSRPAQRVDAMRRAPVTTDVERWSARPGRWDYPGIDTPRAAPRVLPKDLAHARGGRPGDEDSGVNTTISSPEQRRESPPDPLGAGDVAQEHRQAQMTELGIGPDVLEQHAGYLDERERHWERGRSDVEPQERVPDAFHGKEGRDRPHEVGAWPIHGILEERTRDHEDPRLRRVGVRDKPR